MNSKILLGLVVVAIVAVGGYMLLSNNAANVNPTPTETQEAQTTTTEDKAMQEETTNVTVTGSGFEPQTLTVKPGTKVVWTNKSGGPVTVSSDVHPTHLLWPFLNLGKFDNDSSVSVVFEEAGTYTYHNHLDASQTGTVTVK